MATSYCKCGKVWNQDCSFASLSKVNSYETVESFESLMSPNHPSGFRFMSPLQRRQYVTRGEGMVKSSMIHGRREIPSAPDISEIGN